MKCWLALSPLHIWRPHPLSSKLTEVHHPHIKYHRMYTMWKLSCSQLMINIMLFLCTFTWTFISNLQDASGASFIFQVPWFHRLRKLRDPKVSCWRASLMDHRPKRRLCEWCQVAEDTFRDAFWDPASWGVTGLEEASGQCGVQWEKDQRLIRRKWWF